MMSLLSFFFIYELFDEKDKEREKERERLKGRTHKYINVRIRASTVHLFVLIVG